MRKFLFIAAIALLGTVGLSACNNNGNQANTTTQAAATKPTCSSDDPDCMKAWQNYLSQIVQDNMGNITNNPYVYFVPEVPASVVAAVTGSSAQAATGMSTAAAAPGAAPAVAGTAAGADNESSPAATLARVQDQLDTVVQATVLPGNMVAAGGPSSSTTAQVLENAFKQASPGSFKGVVVLFIGDKADEAAVKAAVEPSGATFKFAQM
ncbi:MAG TPA: hypothetical protein VFK29_07785 [Rhodanobacteraceae bacterium]|jgi:hypothetical protein|nr:hypothetical protein [Rhodanobacteraceae bacterium]